MNKSLKLLIALLYAVIPSGTGVLIGHAEQEPAQVSNSAGEQAVRVILKHYSIYPPALDPKTQQPLPGNGSWSVGTTIPAACSQTKGTCVEVFYQVSGGTVRCSWVVLLNADGSDGTFLDENDDAERYLMRIVSQNDAKTLVSSRKKPVFPQIAIMARTSGTVVLNVIIGKTGEVQAVTVVSGPPIEQAAAADAARAWTFKPLMVGTRTIPYEIQLIFNFQTSGPPFGTVTMKP